MIVKKDLPQRSEAWHILHGSVPSASCFSKIVTTRGEPSKQSKDYMLQLAGTRVFGVFEETYMSFDMKQGVEREPDALSAYSLVTGNPVETVGFCYLDERLDRGCSPDGLSGDEGMVEVKSPKLKTHVKYILDDKLPTEYYTQCMGSLYVTGRKWLDFVSYFPDAPLFVKRVYPDDKFIKKLSDAIDKFNTELNGLCEKLSKATGRQQ